MSESKTTLAEAIADWAVELSADVVPPAVREVLTRALMDSLGLMVAARRDNDDG